MRELCQHVAVVFYAKRVHAIKFLVIFGGSVVYLLEKRQKFSKVLHSTGQQILSVVLQWTVF